jgi:hypothetical protein
MRQARNARQFAAKSRETKITVKSKRHLAGAGELEPPNAALKMLFESAANAIT